MARVPFIDPAERPDLAPLAARIQGQRRGSLINIYKVLLNSPGVAESWFEHLNTVRWKTSLSGRLREIVIIRVAGLNACAYAIKQHIPKLAAQEGLNADECAAIEHWREAQCFSPAERAALALTDAMTREIAVGADVHAEIAGHFDATATVDLTVLIGTYNMHTRVVRALDIDLEQD